MPTGPPTELLDVGNKWLMLFFFSCWLVHSVDSSLGEDLTSAK